MRKENGSYIRDVRWEDFQVDLSAMDWMYESMHDMDLANEKFV